MPLLLNEAQVKELLPMSDVIDAMEQALAAFSTGRVRQPVRAIVELGAHGFFGVMPAAIPEGTSGEPAAAGAKIVTVVPRNHHQGLPSHLATVFLLDPETGALDALIDGRYITEARTAAVSAVSARHLARRDAGAIAIVGSGVQARSHASALARVLAVGEFRIWGRNAAHRDDAARDIEHATGARVIACDTTRDAVEGAGVVVLVTGSPVPVIEDAWIADGTHLIGVGACRPTEREMPAALLARARLVVDSREAALKESGDILLARADGHAIEISAELGEICAGYAPGRDSDAGVTIFKSLGLAVEDVASARLVVERARARGIGTEITV